MRGEEQSSHVLSLVPMRALGEEKESLVTIVGACS